MSKYYELLKHPNWQRKRLEVLSRENFSCESCGQTDDTLHVHHTVYRKGFKPWEYEAATLRCLCENCHKEWHRLKSEIDECIGLIGINQLSMALGAIKALVIANDTSNSCKLNDGEEVQGFAHMMDLSERILTDRAMEGPITWAIISEVIDAKKAQQA